MEDDVVRRGVNVLWSMNKAIDFDFDSVSCLLLILIGQV